MVSDGQSDLSISMVDTLKRKEGFSLSMASTNIYTDGYMLALQFFQYWRQWVHEVVWLTVRLISLK